MFEGARNPVCVDLPAQGRAAELGRRHREGMDVEELVRAEISNYNFFHEIQIVSGIRTKGVWWSDLFISEFEKAIATLELRGRSVLDIGARDGGMSLIAEARGAARVVALDNDPSPGLVNFLIPFRSSCIEPLEGNLYDICIQPDERFDIAFCLGVIYHLHTPFRGLECVRNTLKPGGTLVLETAVLDAFEDFPVVLYAPGKSSPYEASSPTFFNVAALRAALTLLGFSNIEQSEFFSPSFFNPGYAFPNFAKKHPEKMVIQRVLMRADYAPKSSGVDGYFAGTHRYHSSGGKGF